MSIQRLLRCSLVLVSVMAVSGCLDPRRTRWPTLYPAHPIAENKAFEYDDPFPDPDLAPDTLARPRGYTRPRTEPRRAAEQRMLNGLRQEPDTIPPFYPPAASRYSDAVR